MADSNNGRKRCRDSGTPVVGNVTAGDRITCPTCGARATVSQNKRIKPHPEALPINA